MTIINDQRCGWIKDLYPRKNIKSFEGKKEDFDWIIIGAGYTGLSAARKLGELFPNQSVALVDAQLAGEGASSRNSGYLVDTTLNDGFTSNKDLENYKIKTDIYNAGINCIKKFINNYQVDCELNEAGKYFATSKLEDEKILIRFSKILKKLNFENKIFYEKDLFNKLGTKFYKIGLYTKGGMLLHPGKLVRAMIGALPNNVNLYENTFLIKWEKEKDKIICKFKNGKIITKKIIFATNGFLNSLGIKPHYNFPLTLTASMTRPLTDQEFENIGRPNEWGVLPVRPLGATIRFTKNKRLLIRNTAELHNPNYMSEIDLEKRIYKHKIGLTKRFPELPNNIIESSWSGIVSRTRNSSQLFECIDKNVFVAGCYNGSGIGVGTLFGEQIVNRASGINTDEIELIEKRKKPTLLPPNPFLKWGINLRLKYERLRANSEI